VLETLKAQYKVTWVLLNESSVVALDEGVLTLRFPRPGNVKGFAGGRHEDVLKQVLQARFGVTVMVRAISGGDPPPGERRRPAPEPVPAPPPGSVDPGGRPPGDPPRMGGLPAPPSPPGPPGPPAPPDDDFDPDDEDMAAPAADELTGMALVQRELGGQVIGEFED